MEIKNRSQGEYALIERKIDRTEKWASRTLWWTPYETKLVQG